MRLLLRWILNAAALVAVAYLVPSLVSVDRFTTALIAALVLGLVNTFVRPVLALLTLPISILTLGVFYLVLNGLLFWAVASMLEGFRVSGFWGGVFGGLLYGLVSWALDSIVEALLPGRRTARA